MVTDEEWQKYVWEQSRRVERENRQRGLPKLEWHLGQLRWVEAVKGKQANPLARPDQLEPVED